MIQSIMQFLVKYIWRFSITGHIPHDIPKKLFVVYPHTSNWDFPLGIAVRGACGLKISFLGKESLFRWPFGGFFRWMGGIPVVRSKSTQFVDNIVEQFNKNDTISFVIAPEGTRKQVQKFKSGFYYMADLAKVPMILVKFDWKQRVVDFSKPFYTTGVYGKDLVKISEHFKGVQGYHPSNACDLDAMVQDVVQEI